MIQANAIHANVVLDGAVRPAGAVGAAETAEAAQAVEIFRQFIVAAGAFEQAVRHAHESLRLSVAFRPRLKDEMLTALYGLRTQRRLVSLAGPPRVARAAGAVQEAATACANLAGNRGPFEQADVHLSHEVDTFVDVVRSSLMGRDGTAARPSR